MVYWGSGIYVTSFIATIDVFEATEVVVDVASVVFGEGTEGSYTEGFYTVFDKCGIYDVCYTCLFDVCMTVASVWSCVVGALATSMSVLEWVDFVRSV